MYSSIQIMKIYRKFERFKVLKRNLKKFQSIKDLNKFKDYLFEYNKFIIVIKDAVLNINVVPISIYGNSSYKNVVFKREKLPIKYLDFDITSSYPSTNSHLYNINGILAYIVFRKTKTKECLKILIKCLEEENKNTYYDVLDLIEFIYPDIIRELELFALKHVIPRWEQFFETNNSWDIYCGYVIDLYMENENRINMYEYFYNFKNNINFKNIKIDLLFYFQQNKSNKSTYHYDNKLVLTDKYQNLKIKDITSIENINKKDIYIGVNTTIKNFLWGVNLKKTIITSDKLLKSNIKILKKERMIQIKINENYFLGSLKQYIYSFIFNKSIQQHSIITKDNYIILPHEINFESKIDFNYLLEYLNKNYLVKNLNLITHINKNESLVYELSLLKNNNLLDWIDIINFFSNYYEKNKSLFLTFYEMFEEYYKINQSNAKNLISIYQNFVPEDVLKKEDILDFLIYFENNYSLDKYIIQKENIKNNKLFDSLISHINISIFFQTIM